MAMRSLVEAECGGPNPLVDLASHFTDDKSLRQEGLLSSHPTGLEQAGEACGDALAEQFLYEFLQESGQYDAPQTFNMQGLLHEMHQLQHGQHTLLEQSRDAGMVEQWADELVASEERRLSQHWRDEHSATSLDAEQWAGEFGREEEEKHMWAEEFVREQETDALRAVAQDLVQSTSNNPQLGSTKFMSFIRRLGDGSIDLHSTDNKILSQSLTDEISQLWADEYDEEQAAAAADLNHGVDFDSQADVFQSLQNEWARLAEADKEHPWLDEYDSFWNKEYQFQKENPLKDYSNAYKEGLRRLKEGDLANAILLFEAAVQTDRNHVEAWQHLGMTQAQNEQDAAAIAALQKCISLSPDNLTALQSLAVSFTNESLQSQACDALVSWLRANPRYKHIVPPEESVKSLRSPSLMTHEEFKRVEELYLTAAQRDPEFVDPEIQVGLGILFNLSGEYNKAVDCFQTALQVKSEDPLLWNKLGATLANGNRSEEAISAYQRALELSPGFVRARYNLGISCINLGTHGEAAEHFVTALDMQQQGLGPGGERSQMSDSIWSTLRMCLVRLGRPDCVSQCDNKDLERLKEEFHL